MVGRPTSIVICGQPFTVEWVEAPSPLSEGTDLGTTNVNEQRIVVRAFDQGAEQERDTVLHEIIHAAVRMTAHRDDFRREEVAVYALATALLAVLRGNPDLVAWLTEAAA